ncbi:hypothetical protein ALC60_02382 [Trachymyrmex zeteki]|uniref:Uncharacterized protein n=1 Tax=Mycetomoellerius zeteki TaxID=64791 RepID=A0A151XEC9_9HYME|nr:hypothetical protein ALC60_02382 [Trachymyrmex zeteki]
MLYGGACIWCFAKDRELYTVERNQAVKTLSKVYGKRSKTKLLGAAVKITTDFRRGIADRYLDFVVLPLHYEIVVNVFRTRPRHLVKFQSSRPIVAVRADSGNYRPIKPPLTPAPYTLFYSARNSARITPRFALKWCIEKRREERTWSIIAWFSSKLSVCLRIPRDEATRSVVFMRQKCVVLETPRFLVENPMIFHFSIFSYRALALFGDAGTRSFEYSGLTQMIISGGVSTLPGLFRECHG